MKGFVVHRLGISDLSVLKSTHTQCQLPCGLSSCAVLDKTRSEWWQPVRVLETGQECEGLADFEGLRARLEEGLYVVDSHLRTWHLCAG